MIVTVDSSALAILINPAANPPIDPSTGKPLQHAKARVDRFVSELTRNDTFIIPTPVLAEVLVVAGDEAPAIHQALAGLARAKIRPFGERAAIETAYICREAKSAGDKRGGSTDPWQKVKFDRQIVAIARVEGSDAIFSDDQGLVTLASRLGMRTISTWDLPTPEEVSNLFTVSGLGDDGQGCAEAEESGGRQSIDMG